ncbi:MAG: hypothetical protein BECKG1743D_GA0114223_105854 [Candidatus Kentron sp. G]|nr:MAG: hypothetical protein BECKG1743F_GA0114225_105813 [Candidatus Kentron sp. G]VFN03266.1 MAG: hypothetical protein BECKG1743E_GA0114224_105953 [Candidatus Kentron sp. G]VFN04422.1 MAG: hypothetical protein BECKG1743D_GA0114223_105854 [Candidatus Kentron sp. G]
MNDQKKNLPTIQQQLIPHPAIQLLRQVGQIEALHMMETVSGAALAQIYIDIKESGAYKGFTYETPDGKTETISTLDRFCEVFLGKSGRRCRQLHEHVTLMGQELYETAERIGFRTRDYAAFKTLPEGDQEAVRAALEKGDAETAMSTLAGLLAKKDKALADTKKKSGDLERIIDNKDTRIAALDGELDRLSEENRDLKRANDLPSTPVERISPYIGEIAVIGEQCKVRLARIDQLRMGALELTAHPDIEPDSPDAEALNAALARLHTAMNEQLTDIETMAGNVMNQANATLPFEYQDDD